MKQIADLISPAYLATQRYLHALPEGYGGKGSRWADTVESLAKQLGALSVLDYGCGRGSLAIELRARHWTVREYDPAVDGKDERPLFADLVVCTDVLEHIEPDRLSAVLTHLRQLARKGIFLVVSTRPSNKTLPDGRNAHLIVKDGVWWRAQVEALGMTIVTVPMALPRKLPGKGWIAVVQP